MFEREPRLLDRFDEVTEVILSIVATLTVVYSIPSVRFVDRPKPAMAISLREGQ